MRVLFALVVLTACRVGFEDQPPRPDASVAPPIDYTSGTRLRAIVQDTPGAAAVGKVIYWFDSQLGEECLFAPDEMGVTRCFPSRASQVAQYADAGCTIPLLRNNQPLDAASCPSAAKLGTIGINGEPHRLVDVGASYSGTVYQGSSCGMIGNDGHYWQAGAVHASDELVARSETVVPAGGLGYVQRVTTDGASELDPYSLVNMATGERCQIITTHWDHVMCIPQQRIGFPVFADAGCSEPAVASAGEPGPTLFLVARGLCEETVTEVTVGDELAAYYQRDAGMCTAQTPSGIRVWRTITTAPAGLVTGTLAVEDLGGVAAKARWQLSTGHSLPAGIYDTRKGDFCYPITLQGTRQNVCAPMWSAVTPLYGDSTCTTGINAIAACDGPWRATWYPSAPWEPTCDGGGEYVRAYTVPVTAPTYARTEAGCGLLDPSISVFQQNPQDYPASDMIAVSRRIE